MIAKHDCYFAHTEPKNLVCEKCTKREGCTFNKNFPPHDCYYPEKQNCEMCFHRFYCTFKVVLPPAPELKYVYVGEQPKLGVMKNPKFKGKKHGKV